MQLTTFRIILAGLVVMSGTASCWAQFETSSLLSVSRSGGQTGTTFDVRVGSGSQLIEIDSLQFSNSAISAELKTLDPLPFTQDRLPDYGNFRVAIPSDLPTGRYEVRAIGRHGVSNPRAFLVSGIPNALPSEVSHDASSPTQLTMGTLLHAKSTAAEVDFYTVQIAYQQSLQLELFAQRLDSRMIGHLKLFDVDGREVASWRGADDIDPVLQTPSDLPSGDYLLAVHDVLYRGGDEYHYQVLSRPMEHATELTEDVGAGDGRLPEIWAVRSFAVNDLVPLDHIQPASLEGKSIELPFSETHWFPRDQQDAVFEFQASEGEQLAIEVVSQRAGQPTDPRLIVQRCEPQEAGSPKLHDVLSIDDSQSVSDGAMNLFSTDPVAFFKGPANGQYRVAIRDLDIGDSLAPRQAFRLAIHEPNPGFDLIAYRAFPNRDVNQTQPFASKVFRGGSEQLRVFVVRRDGWTGAVRLRCEGLPTGVTASEAIIAPNQSQVQLSLTASEDAPKGVVPIRVIGQSDDGMIEREAVAATIQWGKGAGRDFIQSRLTSGLWVAVSEVDLSPLSIVLGEGDVREVKKGEAIKLPIKLVRREGGGAACVARPRDLPSGMKAAEVTIPADKSEAECEIKVEPGAAAGTYSLWLQIETKIKIKPNPQELERAQQYRSDLQSLHDDPAQAPNLDAIKAAIAEADKRVQAATGSAKEKELTVFIPTSNATIRVVEP